MAVHKIQQQRHVILSCCYLPLHVKDASLNKNPLQPRAPSGRSSQHILVGAMANWLLFLEGSHVPCYERRRLSGNRGPVTKPGKLSGMLQESKVPCVKKTKAGKRQSALRPDFLDEDCISQFLPVTCTWHGSRE